MNHRPRRIKIVGHCTLSRPYKQAGAGLVPRKAKPIRTVGLARGKAWIAPDIEAFEKAIAKQMEEEPIEPTVA